MAHGLSTKDPLQSLDGSKVEVKDDELQASDFTVQELLIMLIKEVRGLKEIIVAQL